MSLPPWFGPTSLPLIIHHRRIDAKERKRGCSGLERSGAGQWGDHLHAGFGLPPGVDDRAAFAADVLVIPDPCLGIDRFAHGAEQAKGGKVVLRRPFVSPFHEGADGGWRGVENGHAVMGDDAPEAVRLRPVRSALVHESRRAVGQRAIDDVAVARDPADVGGAPEGVLLAEIEDIFRGDGDTEQVAARGVEDALGFSGRAAGVEDEERVFAVERLGGTVGAHVFGLAVPPDVAAFLECGCRDWCGGKR